jgi:hypothetical protein
MSASANASAIEHGGGKVTALPTMNVAYKQQTKCRYNFIIGTTDLNARIRPVTTTHRQPIRGNRQHWSAFP